MTTTSRRGNPNYKRRQPAASTARLTFLMTARDRDRIRAVARSRGVSVSSFVRTAAMVDVVLFELANPKGAR